MSNIKILAAASAVALLLSGLTASAGAETRVTLKSAKSTSSYYLMTVQLAEAMKAADSSYVPTVEESQGSVQNVLESKSRPGNYIFTTPPSLLASARQGKKPFEAGAFDNARTLFVMPFVTVHLVARADAGINSIADLAGKTMIPGGKGSFCGTATEKILAAFGLTDKVKTVEVELSAAGPAMRNGKVDAFATCSSHPTPQLVELATTTPIRILSLSEAERTKVLALDASSGPLTIAANTYKGQDKPVNTVGLPVGAYGTTAMSDDVAYFVTRTFWEGKTKLAEKSPWWNGVEPDMVKLLGAEVHPGAMRYYKEKGIAVK
ncbi:MAG: TAXI family TRAP transporter solute-binding subunit [Burkholderiaceae bacterium]|nr:TAXI family TRAP transporter solute-binding subunit [Burkholderiaceae bacterium]